ncbi:EboA domain-containing protein [Symbioplanes lichenis]|uniref:EboA domain-containing protein n=1 Tax=Symbioplanes lichenis TaxID=1629072 RepID=UPI0027396AFF|nr:EboA domain-containing protein [Actinoplanes lichenis]
MRADELRGALPGVPEKEWLSDAEARVRTDPDQLPALFARAGRKLGRQPLADRPDWTPGLAGRVLLLLAVPHKDDRVLDLYWHGDTGERLAVLHALALLPIGDAGVPLVEDALRTNDTRLVAAALGPYARHLSPATWRQGVVKCVFMGVPLSRVDRLDERADAELAAMLTGLAQERAAAGRRMPADATALLNRIQQKQED